MTRSEANPRMIRQPDASTVDPLFPGARVLKRSVLEAEEILRERQAVLDAAHAEAETIRTQAHEEGARRAEEAAARASSDARAEAEGLVSQLREMVASTDRRVAELAEVAALRVAQAVLNAEVATRPGALAGLVLDAIEAARAPGRIVAHVHPDNHAALSEVLQLDGQERLALRADPEVPEDGVCVETDLGRVEDALSKRLGKIEQRLIQNIRDGHKDD